MVLLALCAPCCSPARLPRWPRATVTTPNSAADVDPMLLLGLTQAEKYFEVRAVRPPGSLQVLRG